jgi:4-amino-4-deoxy-L-arabinose transferase-like glycosyltransferase
MSRPLNFPLSYRDILIAVAIVLFAYMLRVIVVFDRAHSDPFFDPLPGGRDQNAYMFFAEEYEARNWPTEPFRYQPGFVYYLVGIRALVGTSIGTIRLVTSLAGALGCGFMVGVGWVLTGRKWGGYLTGLLMAVYPVAIFYSTELLTEPLATFLVSIWLFFALWQWKSPAIWRSVVLGLVLGLLAITRTNLTLLWFAGLVILIPPPDPDYGDREEDRPRAWPFLKHFVPHAIVSLVFMALVIAPVTLWNIRVGNGEFQLITSTGMDEVYRANNRDATGTRSGDPAMETVDDGYDHALITDIQRNPLRFIELQLRKAGIYWSAQEPINNIDYVGSGEAVSPLLAAIPLDFGILTLAGWLGVVALYRDHRLLGIFFTVTNLLMFAGVMVVWIEGRLKQPAIVPLIATSAYLIVHLVELARGRGWQTLARRYTPAAVGLLAVFLSLHWARVNLPAKHPTSLPADVRSLDVVFDGKLRLLGWRTLPEWPAPTLGWSHYLRSYVVELFWQVDTPVAEDYNVYVAYVDGGERYAGIDRAIGAVSFRPWLTSQWQPGEIYGEILGFRLPFDIPPGRSGDIRLGVYRLDTNDQQVVNVRATSLHDTPEAISLQRLAVFDLNLPVSVLEERTPSAYVFGDRIALRGYTLPDSATPDERVRLSFGWEAVAEMPADYTMFLHVVDEDEQLAGQLDTPPLGNILGTANWPPNYPIHDEVTLTMPQAAGDYRVYMGLYDALTGERLAVDAKDNRVLLGEIEVE